MNLSIHERAIILAPRGRDAAVALAMLHEAGMAARTATDIPTLTDALRAGAGFAVITEETLRGADLRGLASFIGDQAEWSDFPFILLTERGGGLERNPAAVRLLETLGNVTFLERPFHPTTLVSLARSALRARRRQYDARSRLEEIREGEERLRIAFSAGGLGAWTLDVATNTMQASIDCKAHHGRAPADDFDLNDLLACVHYADGDLLANALRKIISTGDDYDVEYRCFWIDGSMHWVQSRARLISDARGMADRLVGVSQDITKRKEDEEALRDFASELERRVEERTREREEVIAQLHEAQKLEMLGQLTGGVAHDFNNLLTPVIGNLDMLRRRHDDERSQRLIDSALKASDRARTLVSRLLAFARRQILESTPVDPHALVEGMLDLLQRSLGPQIEITVEAPHDLPAAMVDPNQLELALLNLAVNARDAMPDGGRLRITLGSEDAGASNRANVAPGRYIRLAIIDAGTGMDEATLRHAVEPFYSTKGVGKGTGLGLSMVHGLAAQSGGALLLTSRPGEGTTAELWLPVANHPAPAAPLPQDDTQIEMSPMRVLLVDDEELVRSGTADMLSDMGHQVIQAASGSEALELMAAVEFDIIVSDYVMPGMTGVDLAADVHRARPAFPILLITGYADMTDGAGFALPRLPKPFRQHELARALVQVRATATF